MDEKELIESKLMANHSEYEQIMASQNPYKYGAKGWIALANELLKGEGNVPTEEQMIRLCIYRLCHTVQTKHTALSILHRLHIRQCDPLEVYQCDLQWHQFKVHPRPVHQLMDRFVLSYNMCLWSNQSINTDCKSIAIGMIYDINWSHSTGYATRFNHRCCCERYGYITNWCTFTSQQNGSIGDDRPDGWRQLIITLNFKNRSTQKTNQHKKQFNKKHNHTDSRYFESPILWHKHQLVCLGTATNTSHTLRYVNLILYAPSAS